MKKLLMLTMAGSILLAGECDAKLEKLKMEFEKFKKEMSEQIDELYDRADENELQASLNKIKWSGEFETRVGNYSGERTDFSTGKTKKFRNNNKWDMRIKLNMEAKINEKTKFTGRIMVSKAWANSTGVFQSQLDMLQGRANGNAKLALERAYIDYKFTPNFIMTIGRQPSSDGPGMNLKYDTPRKATYPALLFNGEADGIVFTYKTKPATFRLAYGKGYQWQDINNGYTSGTSQKDTNVYGFFAEGRLPFDIGENLLIFSATKTTDLIANPFDASNNNMNLGDYTHLGLYFENNKAFKTKLSYFISLAYANPNGNGKSTNIDFDGDGVVDMPNVKLLKKSGYAYHIGLRYDIKNNFKVGYEFNHGSRYWFSFSSNIADPINKLAARGNVNDFYLIYNLDMNQYFRLGYTRADIDYAGSGMYYWMNGEPNKVDEYYDVLYTTYDVRF
jgi:hypothetical protein